MKSNINKLILIEVIAGILVAFTGLLFYSMTHVSENARHFFNGPKQSDCNENYLRIHRLQRPDHVVDHESDPFSWR